MTAIYDVIKRDFSSGWRVNCRQQIHTDPVFKNSIQKLTIPKFHDYYHNQNLCFKTRILSIEQYIVLFQFFGGDKTIIRTDFAREIDYENNWNFFEKKIMDET